jgi:hypothetical protein
MRRLLPGQSAQMASATGDDRQARAIAEELSKWNAWERHTTNFLQSSKAVDEARRWMCSRIKNKAEDAASPLPELFVRLVTLQTINGDIADDALLEESVRKAIIKDAVAYSRRLPPTPNCESPPMSQADQALMRMIRNKGMPRPLTSSAQNTTATIGSGTVTQPEATADASHLPGAESRTNVEKVDTNVDKKKLSTRGLSPAARQCIRKYKAKHKEGDRTTMNAVILDYIDAHPEAKYSSIRRSPSAHSKEWKVDTKVDKAV